MDRNEKIAVAIGFATAVIPAALYAVARKKTSNPGMPKVKRNNPIKTVITLANTLSA